MQVIERIEDFRPPAGGSALTIGNFDGVHMGHKRLLARVTDAARRLRVPALAITFDAHPLSVLAPQRVPPRLTTFAERCWLLGHAGIDATVILRSEPALFERSADEFLRLLATTCRPRQIVEGPTFHFGKGRTGSVETLRASAARYGYELEVVDNVVSEALSGAPPVSSSLIRARISAGEVGDACLLLGRPHRVSGVIGEGDRRGATIGFATANLQDVAQLEPGSGVYAAIAQCADGTMHLAAVNVGPQPTFGQRGSRVEAHLLDFAGDLRGQKFGLHFLEKLRDQQKFPSVAELVAQLTADVRRTRHFAQRLRELAACERWPL